jgi:cell division protein FtsI (penicillin-binding protein 3)
MNINRLLSVVAIVVIAFCAVIVRLFYVQIIKGDELSFFANRQQTVTQKISAERGMIFDRNNVLLSYNKNDVSFYLDLSLAKKRDIENIIAIFSKTFSKPISHYKTLISNSSKRVCLERKVTGTEILQLKDLKYNGFYFEEDPTRIYPYNNLASHIIGHLDVNFEGVDGIEKTFNNELKGIEGKRVILRDAKGNLITVKDGLTIPSQPGKNTVLTINRVYQSILDEELNRGLQQFGGAYALGILMNPNTGEIMALSNQLDYNLNHYNAYSDSIRRNKVLTDTYEPGSTFKSIAMSVFLDKKICSENDLVNGEMGTFQFKKIKIKDSHPEGIITVKEVFAKSSNIGMSKLSQKIDDEEFYSAVRSFGFGNNSNISLPGEVKGKLKNPSEWSVYSKSSLSFGYEVAVTPIQLVTAYSAIINGGILYQPQVIKEIKNHNGEVIKKFEPKEIRRVIQSTTSQKMREFLESAVENGTGKKARLNGITIGGKTGTSRKLVDGKYSQQFYNASFVGFFPVENPQYVMLILVNSPTQSSYYGGDVAAPIFKKVTERIILIDESLWNFRSSSTEGDIDFVYASNSTGIQKTQNVVNVAKTNLKIDRKTMPNLVNLDMREAVKILSQLNIDYEIIGNGKVIEQTIIPGSRISSKSKCKIKFAENINIAATLY